VAATERIMREFAGKAINTLVHRTHREESTSVLGRASGVRISPEASVSGWFPPHGREMARALRVGAGAQAPLGRRGSVRTPRFRPQR